MTYTVRQHQRMLADEVRVNAYENALRQTVQPGSVVVDIGSGLGLFALLAVRFGASRVYAIEADDVIELARQIARVNGCADRIEFISDLSTKVELPARADVVVSDLHGALPFYSNHLPSVIDARRRFLKSGGALIPRRDTLWAAVIEDAELCPKFGSCGFDMLPAQGYLANSWIKSRVRPEQLLVEPYPFEVLDYALLESSDLSARLSWTCKRSGTAAGVAMWFDGELADGIRISNAPGGPELVYANACFPFREPVPVSAGVHIVVDFEAKLLGSDYVWRWRTRVTDQSTRIAEFEQSTFSASPLAPARLRKRSSTHVPSLTRDGEIDRFILGAMNGTQTVAEIARAVSAHFNDRFPTERDALGRVGELSSRHSL